MNLEQSEMKHLSERLCEFDMMGVTEIYRGKRLPDEVDFDICESRRWLGISVVHNGTLYYKKFDEPANHQPDFDPEFYAGLVSDLVGDSTTKALMFLFYCTAASSGMDAYVYMDTFENLDWFTTDPAESIKAEYAHDETVWLYGYEDDALFLKFKAPEHVIAYQMAFQTALDNGYDPDEVVRDVSVCLRMLNELSLSATVVNAANTPGSDYVGQHA